jgi:plastocyanin
VETVPTAAISPASATLDVGQPVTFISTVSSGTPPYSYYQWYLNGNPVSGATNSTWVFTPSSTTSYTVYVKVIDNVGMQVASNTVTVTVNSALSVAITPTSVTIDVGQSVTFASAVSGGTPSYSYQWYLNTVAVTGATNATWTYTPTSAASYTVYLKVTDSASPANTVTSNTATVSVSASLSVTVSPGLNGLDVGQSVTFTSTVSGGTSPYSYKWYLNGVLNSSATGYSWTYTFTSSGSYTVYVKVTDATGDTAISNAAVVTVNVAPSVAVSPSSGTIDVGQSVTFNSTISGGTSPYTYQWYLNGSAVSDATGSSWTYTFTTSASFTVYVKVSDAVTFSATSNIATITVQSPTISLSISSQMTHLDGTVSSSFLLGQGVMAEAVITNTGTTAITNAFCVVTFKNPDSTVIFTGYVYVSLGAGQQQTVSLGTTLSTNSVLGTYAVGVIVYTAQPSSGGTVISGGANLANFEAS